MTQDAVVTKLLPNRMAEVAVTRTTACGGNCGNCESCIYQSELKTLARNLVEAKPGQRVLIESKSSAVFGAAVLVYVVPLLLLLAAYAVAHVFGASEPVKVLASFLGLAMGAVILVVTQRHKKSEISFDIVALQ